MKYNNDSWFKIGDRFVIDRVEFILAQVSYGRVTLINLYGGNRWKDPVNINNPHYITMKEFVKIVGKIHLNDVQSI